MPSLKVGGVLIYSTCSYSQEEDEEIADWLKKELIINNEELIINPVLGVIASRGGYRFWPDKIKGEGFFIACFRKAGEEDLAEFQRRKKVEKITSAEMKVLENYLQTDGFTFLKREKSIHAVPEIHAEEIDFLSWKLRTINVGIKGQPEQEKRRSRPRRTGRRCGRQTACVGGRPRHRQLQTRHARGARNRSRNAARVESGADLVHDHRLR
jgi:hypothetical protein